MKIFILHDLAHFKTNTIVYLVTITTLKFYGYDAQLSCQSSRLPKKKKLHKICISVFFFIITNNHVLKNSIGLHYLKIFEFDPFTEQKFDKNIWFLNNHHYRLG